MKKHDEHWSAFSEMGEWTWRRVEGSEGRTWYIPLIPNAADWIHVDHPEKTGYQGSTIELTVLQDGGENVVDKVNGPWHSTAKDLQEDTGINLSHLNLTKLQIRIDGGKLIYTEHEPVLGTFSRGLRIAEQLANIYGKPVSLEAISTSGRQLKYVEPVMGKDE